MSLRSATSYYSDPRKDFPELLRVISRSCRIGGRALDIGCGFGYVGAALRELGYDEVWGVEPDPGASLAATERLDRVIAEPFPSVSLRQDGPFDMILFADSIEHIGDPWAALTEVHRLLAPRGQLVMSVPNVSHYSVILQLLRGRWDYQASGLLDKTHLRFFTPKSLTTTLNDCDFAVLAEHPIVVKPGPAYAPAVWIANRFVKHVFVFQEVVIAEPADVAAS